MTKYFVTLFYDLGLCLFYGIMLLASVFHPKARKWIKGRNKLLRNLKAQFSPADKVMWMHCSSLGEFEQGRPLLEEFRLRKPDYKILLSFFSPSGYEMRKNYVCAEYVCYLPLDTWFNARSFIKAAHPDVVFFVKYDLWYHHLNRARKQGAEMYLISAVFNPKQLFFKWYGGFFRSMLLTFKRIFVQNNTSKQLLQNINIKNTMISGDTRLDRVIQISKKATDYPLIKQFVGNKPCLICGSTWPKDETIIAKASSAINNVKLIIAPHQIHEAHIADIEKLFAKQGTIRYTQIGDKNISDYNVLIVDTIGMLSSIYRYGQAAYIGGGFEDGIHNTLEAIVYGIPVVFGPNYDKFVEAVDLIALGGAVSIKNESELQDTITNWFTNINSRSIAGDICKNYILQQQNATEKILANL